MAVPTQRLPAGTGPARRPGLRRLTVAAAVLACLAGLFAGYLAMSRTQPTNADGASQALQAWDLLHGNVALAGWTASDVPFYTNEVPLLAVIEAVHGLDGDVVHIGAAVLYTLLVFGVAVLARGRAGGREAVARVAVAVAPLLVPMAGIGVSVLLLSPDHTGTGVPLLATLILIDRAVTAPGGQPRAGPRWLPYAVGSVLTVAAISDPLAAYVGALPVLVVCGTRLWRAGRRRPAQWRGPDAQLAVAAVASVVASRGFLFCLQALGGLRVHEAGAGLAAPARLLHNLWVAVVGLSADFGAYPPDRHGALDGVVGVIRLAGLVATLAVVALVLLRWLRGRSPAGGGLVDELLAVGVLINLGAFLASTIPYDVTSARQVTPVLFLGGALLGRVLGVRVARARWLPAAVAAIVLVAAGEFAVRGTRPAVPDDGHRVARFLEEHRLTYGLGGFWTANNITLQTGRRVQVVPVAGADRVYGYQWLSRRDWYDPARHDARFVLLQVGSPEYGAEAASLAQFGPPVARYQVDRVAVLVYDHNLLAGLPALCWPGTAPSMAECP